MEFLEKIEERIEDEKENKRYYGFNEICDKLVEYKKLDLEISNELKSIYETIRNPIQHGLYSRIIRQNIGNKRIPATKIAIKLDGTPEELIKSMTEGMNASSNTTISLHNPITRMFVLPEFFKNESIKFLFIIRDLITKIK